MDDIWKKSEGASEDISKQNNDWFHFCSGLEGHELIYDVSHSRVSCSSKRGPNVV